MEITQSVAELRRAVRAARQAIGFVPTMGYLHDGHGSLIERARAEAGLVVVSIFVNPTQFGPNEDYDRYPRDFDRDRQLCERAGADVVFYPDEREIYPPGFSTVVDVAGITARLEGEHRPSHFQGVTTIVAKLFNVVMPDRAYFGEKDYQQLQVIRKMVRDLHFPVEIVGCPTVREPDGLALSSRNAYLGPSERRQATVLYRALQEAQALAMLGERDPKALEAELQRTLETEPNLKVDYAVVVDAVTLEPLRLIDREARALIAARLGGTRLIDNAAIVTG